MIVSTRRLFLRLLQPLGITTVCDVGSMDGSDALQFRRVLPAASILALEPNPKNFAVMAADERLRRARIRILPVAASDRRGEAPFYVIETDYTNASELARRGMSSLYQRADWLKLTSVVQVPTARLDEVIADEGLPVTAGCAGGNIGLWIDTEGMAFEAVAGASGVLGRTQLVHVEVETAPCIGASQKLFSDVERLLADAGLTLLATDQSRAAVQFNALFVRADALRRSAAEVRWHVAWEKAREAVAQVVRPLLPPPFKEFVVRRLGTARGR